MSWDNFDNGESIGKRGSEGGIILHDTEHSSGARITMEKDGTTAPYCVTLGIYGLMFHTHFAGTEEAARTFIDYEEKISISYSGI